MSKSILIICVYIALFPSLASSQGLAMWLSKQQYRSNCASCHGEDGKGDGPKADQLVIKPANLQMIRKNNDGKFPTEEISKFIDGRETGRRDGSDMPVWGNEFKALIKLTAGKWPQPAIYAEHAITGRILSLVYYIESIQAE